MNQETRPGLGGLGWNVLSAAVPLIGSFVVSIVLAPWFGERGFGVYSLVLTVATFALILAKFGIHAATSRLLSEHRESTGPWLRAGLLARLLFTLPTATAVVFLAPFLARQLGAPEAVAGFRWAGGVVVAVSLFEFATESLVGLRSFRAQTRTRIVALILRLAAVFGVRLAGLGLVAFLIGHTTSFLVPALVALGILLLRHRGGQADGSLRRTLEIATPMAFASASFLIYSHTDRLMLGWLHGPEVVGQFGVARNVIDAALFPTAALSWSLRPVLVRAATPEAMRPILGEGMRLSLIYMVLAVALLAPIGDRLLPGIYSAQYADAGRYFLGLLPVLGLRAASTIVFPALIAIDGQATYGRLMVFTAALNVALNFLLIPRFGAWGAIAATTLALAGLTVGGLQQLRNRGCGGYLSQAFRRTAPPLGVGLAGAAGLVGLRQLEPGWPVLLAAATGFGVVAAFLILRRSPPRLGDA